MDLDVFSAGFFDKNVGVAPRTCISYIKFGSFLRFGPFSPRFDVLFAANWQIKGFLNQFEAQNAGKLGLVGASRFRELGIQTTGARRTVRVGNRDCQVRKRRLLAPDT